MLSYKCKHYFSPGKGLQELKRPKWNLQFIKVLPHFPICNNGQMKYRTDWTVQLLLLLLRLLRNINEVWIKQFERIHFFGI